MFVLLWKEAPWCRDDRRLQITGEWGSLGSGNYVHIKPRVVCQSTFWVSFIILGYPGIITLKKTLGVKKIILILGSFRYNPDEHPYIYHGNKHKLSFVVSIKGYVQAGWLYRTWPYSRNIAIASWPRNAAMFPWEKWNIEPVQITSEETQPVDFLFFAHNPPLEFLPGNPNNGNFKGHGSVSRVWVVL